MIRNNNSKKISNINNSEKIDVGSSQSVLNTLQFDYLNDKNNNNYSVNPLNSNSMDTDDYCSSFSNFNNYSNHFQSDLVNTKGIEYLAHDLLNETNKYDDFDLTESESSSLQQPPVYSTISNEFSNQTGLSDKIEMEAANKTAVSETEENVPSKSTKNTTTSGSKSNSKSKRKKETNLEKTKKKPKSAKPANQRRNIKKILTDDRLNESTLRALNEEKERIERLTKSSELTNTEILLLPESNSIIKAENNLFNPESSIELNTSLNKSACSSAADKSSDQSIYVLEDQEKTNINLYTNTISTNRIDSKAAYFANYNANFYHNLIASNAQMNTNGTYRQPPPPPNPIISEIDLEAENNYDDDIIECDETKINNDDDDDDDDCRIISESEHQQEEQSISKKKLRGIHMNDEKNAPNANGQVLVNVNHSPEDNDVFLLPYLARNVKPHQIGGIRFMYDNIVESLTRIKDKSTGFGCILAHAMGLGKTLQVISFIEVFLRCTQSKRVLCIVPINTIQNWQSEFNNWLPENGQQKLDNDTIINYQRPFKVYMINDYSRTLKQRTEVIFEWTNNGGVLLIGYEMFRTLVTNGKNTKTSQLKKNNSSKNYNSELIDIDDEEESLKKHTVIKESLLTPCLVVCDEGHRIKNNAANIAKTLQTIKTKRRIVLTGYPLQNNLIEYWCMVDFVRPSYLGTKAEFSNMFERPIMNGQCMDSTREDVKLMRFRAHVLHSLLEGFVQRRGHDVFINTLPKKHEYIILLKLSSIQKELYLAFMEAIGAMNSNEKTNPLRSFAICCKIWNHPDVLYKYYTEKESELDLDLPELHQTPTKSKTAAKQSTISSSTSSSLMYQEDGFNPFGAALNDGSRSTNNKNTYDPDWAARLMETYKPNMLENGAKFFLTFSLIEESIKCGDKILLFSQSLLSLDLIEAYLQQLNVVNTNEKWKKYKNYYRLDGSTPGVERERLVNTFNKPNNDLWLFLLSTRAGCLGINLIGANRVIVLDASWNPCHDAQAVCRVYRYGQRKNCFIYRLIADHTMEKKIYDRQISKQSMSDRVIDEIQGENHFTRTEVEKLIHFVKEDVPSADLSNMPQKFTDTVLITSCMKHSHVITKEPFTHESLLIDKKEYQLSEREKALAFREYHHDKKYFPYTRNTNITSTAASLFYQRYGNAAAAHTSQTVYSNYSNSSLANLPLNFASSSSLSNSSTSSTLSNSSNHSFIANSQIGCPSNLYSNILNDNSKDLDFNLNRNLTGTNSFLQTNQISRYKNDNFNSNISNSSPTIMKYLNSSENMNITSNLISTNNYNNNSSSSTSMYPESEQQQSQIIQHSSTPTALAAPQPPNLKDVKISRFTATSQLLIPTSGSGSNNNNNNSTENSCSTFDPNKNGQLNNSIVIQPGQTVFLLQTPKGCYLRTADKKYIALRGQTFEDLFTNGFEKLSTNILNNNDSSMTSQTNENSNFPNVSDTGLNNMNCTNKIDYYKTVDNQSNIQHQQSFNEINHQLQNYDTNLGYFNNNYQINETTNNQINGKNLAEPGSLQQSKNFLGNNNLDFNLNNNSNNFFINNIEPSSQAYRNDTNGNDSTNQYSSLNI